MPIFARPKEKRWHIYPKRNCDKRNGTYDYGLAQRKYEKRKKEKPKFRRFTEEIRIFVDEMLREDLSPEQIVGRCSLLGFPMVSHETIYQHIWKDKRRGGDLYKHLRRKVRRYRKRGGRYDMRGIIRDRVSIDERPSPKDWGPTSILRTPTTHGSAAPMRTPRLIRQYLPKGTPFENLTKEYVKQIQNKLNNRPRKKLGYLTPIEFFNSITLSGRPSGH